MMSRRTPLTPELTEELYASASYLNTQMHRAEVMAKHEFPPDVNAAWTRLSRTLAAVDPLMREAPSAAGDPPEWVLADRGSLWTLKLTPLLTLSVWHEIGQRGVVNPTPYRVTIFGARSSNQFATDEEAKAFALRVADRHLALAATQLRAALR